MSDLTQILRLIQELQKQAAHEEAEAWRRVSWHRKNGDFVNETEATIDHNEAKGRANAYARVLELLKEVDGE